MKHLIFNLVALTFTISLTAQSLNDKEYQAWIREHNEQFLRSATSGDYAYQVMYRPYTLAAINYARQDKPSQKDFKAFMKTAPQTMDFILRIVRNPESGKAFMDQPTTGKSSRDLTMYYSFDFQRDLKLVLAEGDTITPGFFNFERGIGPAGTVEFVFSYELGDRKLPEQLKMVVCDQASEKRQVVFDYNTQQIFNLPKLKYFTKW